MPRKRYYKPKLKGRPVNNISFKVKVPIEKDQDYHDTRERLAYVDKIASSLQKRIRGWWSKQTTSPSIIIVTAGNKVVGKQVMNYIVELNQLGITEEVEDTFKSGAEALVKEILD